MSDAQLTNETPIADAPDSRVVLPREVRRQVVVEVLATAVIDLLAAEHEHSESEDSDAAR